LTDFRLRAVVLAAGKGERLRPLTDFLPKPLLPVRGKPVAAYTLEQLARQKCEAVAINLFHLGDQIRRAFGDSFAGMPLTYSPETELLGTLGALVPLHEFLSAADLILIINGDSLCRWPLRRLIQTHRERAAQASLLVSKRVDPEGFGGGVAVDTNGNVVSFRRAGGEPTAGRRRVFMGAHVLSPDVMERLVKAPADFIADLYEPLLAEGARLAAVETACRWHDLGTPERYLRGARSWARQVRRVGGQRCWVSPEAELAADVSVRQAVVEKGCRLGKGAEISGSLLLEGVRVGDRCRVLQSVVGPGVALPAGTSVEGRMVTRVRSDSVPAASDSVVGGLVYSPLDRASFQR
jgi:NDP-sugar pyrophosphorylase family protein